LEHLGQLFGLLVELALLRFAQLGECPTGLTQRRAKTLSQLPKWLAGVPRARLGYALKIERGNEMGMHGVGHRRCQVELPDLLPHIPRHTLDGGLHFRNHPLGFLDPLQAGLPEAFVLGHGTNGVNLRSNICRNKLAVSAHAALHIDKMLGLADGTDAVSDLLALRADALVLQARRVRFLCDLLQACGGLLRTT